MHCCGSVAFWYGSGSDDPYHWFMYPDTAIFVSGWQDANTKISFFLKFFCLYVHQPSRRKVKKKPQSEKIVKSRICLLFCLLMVSMVPHMLCWFLWVVCSMGGKYPSWGGCGGWGNEGNTLKEIHAFWSCLTLFHHPSLVNLQKQVAPDIHKIERLD